MNKLLENLSHLPSTVSGVLISIATVAVALTNNDIVQQLSASNPAAARWVLGIGGIATGILLVFGVGPKKQ